jgi:hypothetical protein
MYNYGVHYPPNIIIITEFIIIPPSFYYKNIKFMSHSLF